MSLPFVSPKPKGSKESLNQNNPSSRKGLQCLGTIVLLLLIFGLRSAIKTGYEQSIPTPFTGAQDSYHTIDIKLFAPLLDSAAPIPILWLELGKHGSLVKPKIANAAFQISFNGFSPGTPWSREVSWHLSAKEEGSIIVRFPSAQTAALALYLTDGDSYWRASRIRSAKNEITASELHHGRWYLLPLTPEEKVLGKKTITFNKLSGDTIAVSALAAFSEAQ